MNNDLGQVVLVKDINPIVSDGYDDSFFARSSSPDNLVEFDGKLYFSADDGESGTELFVSDGTAEGTQLVANIRPDLPENSHGRRSGSVPNELVEFNNKLFFSANNGESGFELFVSDGTAEGTQLLADIRPGSNYNSFPRYFVELDDKLYFSTKGNKLFVTDGTTEGTQLVIDIDPGAEDLSDFDVGYISQPIEFNGKLYFSSKKRANKVNENQLWVSDGTTEGTQVLVDLEPGLKGSSRRNFIEFNDRFYFSNSAGDNDRELWVSDGTAEGTELLVDLNPNPGNFGFSGSDPRNFIVFDDKLYFTAIAPEKGREIFVSDGTVEGTQLLVDLNPGVDGSSASDFVEFNGRLYFAADDGENGTELFASDGTAEGTQLVADINSGVDGSYASDLTVVGNELFFSADNGETGNELFKLTVEDLSSETRIFITGSQDLDNFTGSDRSEVLKAFGGNDTITGGGGNDTLNGGDGDDSLTGAADNDSLFGGNGNDTLHSGDGKDTLNGGSGNDRLTSFAGNDSLFGANGNDTLHSGDGADTLNGGGGSDSLAAGAGDDILAGGKNNDVLNGDSGKDTLSGDNGEDRLFGGADNDSLIGGNGNDFLDGGIGHDTLNGSNGDDLFVLRAGAGRDTIIDFKLNSDRLGLADGLQFESLAFSGSDILSGGEVLASLNGVDTEQLTAVQFREI